MPLDNPPLLCFGKLFVILLWSFNFRSGANTFLKTWFLITVFTTYLFQHELHHFGERCYGLFSENGEIHKKCIFPTWRFAGYSTLGRLTFSQPMKLAPHYLISSHTGFPHTCSPKGRIQLS